MGFLFVQMLTLLQKGTPHRRTRTRYLPNDSLGTVSSDSASIKCRGGETRKTPRFFDAEEAQRIIAASREPYATIYSVAATAGVRAGELLGLKVTDIDFERRLIFVQRSLCRGKLQSVKSATSVRALLFAKTIS
jgi:integrase